jgi:hypothetical protein
MWPIRTELKRHKLQDGSFLYELPFNDPGLYKDSLFVTHNISSKEQLFCLWQCLSNDTGSKKLIPAFHCIQEGFAMFTGV